MGMGQAVEGDLRTVENCRVGGVFGTHHFVRRMAREANQMVSGMVGSEDSTHPTRNYTKLHEFFVAEDVPIATNLDACAPILAVFTKLNETVKARPRPILDARDEPMLERIDMDVVETPFQVVVIANQMFPKRRCHTPRSPFLRRDALIGASPPPPARCFFVKAVLTSAQREEKSSSPGGRFQMQWR